MPVPSEHPLRALLRSQGRSVRWLAGQLKCKPQTLISRLSGHRPASSDRGPSPWRPAPVYVVQTAAHLGIPHTTLASWLAGDKQ